MVPKVAVMPVGEFDGASVTVELKPLSAAMVTVDVPADPATDVAEVALSEKAGAADTVRGMVVLAVSELLVPLTVSE